MLEARARSTIAGSPVGRDGNDSLSGKSPSQCPFLAFWVVVGVAVSMLGEGTSPFSLCTAKGHKFPFEGRGNSHAHRNTARHLASHSVLMNLPHC